VGQRHLGHEGGAADQFEGKRELETHRMGFSATAGIGWCGSSVRSRRGGGYWSQSGRRGSPGWYGARGWVGGAVPWPEVPVHVEALLDGNDGAGWLAVGSEQRPTVRGGGPSSMVLKEVALAQPDRRWLAWRRAALQRGGVAEKGAALRGNCLQECEREESCAGFSGSSNARIRHNSRGGGDERGVRWPQRRGVAWRHGDQNAVSCMRDQ
jgi:hypothetical protein